jgi:hypothetical protein
MNQQTMRKVVRRAAMVGVWWWSLAAMAQPRPAPAPVAAPPPPPPPPAAAPVAPPPAPSPGRPAKPPQQLEQLKLFLGTWKCSGKQLATPMFGPEHTFTSSASSKPDVDGFWHLFTYEEKKSKDHPGLKLVGHWGYDVGGKRFIRAAGSNQSGWDSATSVGFNGDKMVWTGDFSGPMGRMPFKQTFTRKSDKEWSFRYELNIQGTWVALSEVSCTGGGKK